jgi:hypothetical protein
MLRALLQAVDAVVGVHPVVHRLPRGELVASRDARLQVHHPDVGSGLVEHPQGAPHGQRKSTGRGIGPLAASANST